MLYKTPLNFRKRGNFPSFKIIAAKLIKILKKMTILMLHEEQNKCFIFCNIYKSLIFQRRTRKEEGLDVWGAWSQVILYTQPCVGLATLMASDSVVFICLSHVNADLCCRLMLSVQHSQLIFKSLFCVTCCKQRWH